MRSNGEAVEGLGSGGKDIDKTEMRNYRVCGYMNVEILVRKMARKSRASHLTRQERKPVTKVPCEEQY